MPLGWVPVRGERVRYRSRPVVVLSVRVYSPTSGRDAAWAEVRESPDKPPRRRARRRTREERVADVIMGREKDAPAAHSRLVPILHLSPL